MEKRDGFFTRVKREIELQYQLSEGIKPVLLSHSYGGWVERVRVGGWGAGVGYSDYRLVESQG